MLWSLRIIYILFAGKFKAKETHLFSVLKHLSSSWFNFRTNVTYI